MPVLVYHRLDAGRFSGDMDYLARNGYRTLNAVEHYRSLKEGGSDAERAVVITFDDGLDDLYDVAYWF